MRHQVESVEKSRDHLFDVTRRHTYICLDVTQRRCIRDFHEPQRWGPCRPQEIRAARPQNHTAKVLLHRSSERFARGQEFERRPPTRGCYTSSVHTEMTKRLLYEPFTTDHTPTLRLF